MLAVSFCMLLPFYWVLKTSLTGENIFVYPPSIVPVHPHLFYYVDVWYYIPFPRYLLNSVVVSVLVDRRQRRVQRAGRIRADAALPRPGRRHHHPAVMHDDPVPDDDRARRI